MFGSSKSALSVKKGVAGVNTVNTGNVSSISAYRKAKAHTLSADDYIKELSAGNITMLSRAITLIESSNKKHHKIAEDLIAKALPLSGNSLRIGITGVPGAGKSTFIEAFGMYLIGKGRKVAVLAIDPSSERSGGSILGDKTRMDKLSAEKNAFIRPSPSAGSLGGVARKTAETIILCEAAGFDTLFIETVGVGQSEIAVSSMTDFFMLLQIAGAGDELQGIKRGIMEMADLIVINKADGDNIKRANAAKAEFKSALHLFPPTESKWEPKVVTASSLSGMGIPEIENLINQYFELTKNNKYFYNKRNKQAITRMYETIHDELKNAFYNKSGISDKLKSFENSVLKEQISPYAAAHRLIEMNNSD